MIQADIDIDEEDILKIHPKILTLLLADKTTYRNIIWATHDYEHLGSFYYYYAEIFPEEITGFQNKNIIQPRVCKNDLKKSKRTKDKAEVFTPAWICNIQNNLIDQTWFNKKNVFNTETEKSWVTIPDKIIFSKENDWKKYVDAKRLEVSCGEAPYLVSRYDSSIGTPIPLQHRIGILDRKLRIVNENTNNEKDWIKWAIRAFQSVYGFEFQGDNLLLARENLLFTFIDNYQFKLKKSPDISILKKISNIIAWNIWQMDGMTNTIPFPNDRKHQLQTNLFENLLDKTESTSLPPQKLKQLNEFSSQIKCKIFDWRTKCSLEFASLFQTNKN